MRPIEVTWNGLAIGIPGARLHLGNRPCLAEANDGRNLDDGGGPPAGKCDACDAKVDEQLHPGTDRAFHDSHQSGPSLILTEVRRAHVTDLRRAAHRFCVKVNDVDRRKGRDAVRAGGRIHQGPHLSDVTRGNRHDHGAAGHLWQTVGLLDTTELGFEPSDPDASLAVLDNLSIVRSVPSWPQDRKRPVLWPDAIKELGFTGIPVLESEGSAPRHPLGAAKGAAGRTRVPARLVA